MLAELPLPVYILAAPDPLLALAIGEVELNGKKRKPRVAMLPWRTGVQELLEPLPKRYQPTPEEPLIYHLFGSVEFPHSLVLTQDNYFDFLLSIRTKEVREASTISKVIFERLINSGLIFLGFEFDSWEFRTLFRVIRQLEGRVSMEYFTPHIAAQVEPKEGQVLDPPGAQSYLERYFGQAKIDLYWGTAEHFLAELKQELETTRT